MARRTDTTLESSQPSTGESQARPRGRGRGALTAGMLALTVLAALAMLWRYWPEPEAPPAWPEGDGRSAQAPRMVGDPFDPASTDGLSGADLDELPDDLPMPVGVVRGTLGRPATDPNALVADYVIVASFGDVRAFMLDGLVQKGWRQARLLNDDENAVAATYQNGHDTLTLRLNRERQSVKIELLVIRGALAPDAP